jgi:hypothetical protein
MAFQRMHSPLNIFLDEGKRERKEDVISFVYRDRRHTSTSFLTSML